MGCNGSDRVGVTVLVLVGAVVTPLRLSNGVFVILFVPNRLMLKVEEPNQFDIFLMSVSKNGKSG